MKIHCYFFCLILSSLHLSAQQSQSITFVHGGKTVNGTFTRPQTNGRFPTIIIAPGSGANDRHGTIPMLGANVACLYPNLLNDTLRPYKDLSDALVDSGYAVLRYDKLEYTYPTSLGTITFHKLWLPVESAIDYLKSRNDVDTNQIVLLGHSEGSSLIPYIAKSRTDLKALISIAGPRTPFDSILAYQIVNIAQTCGGNVSQAQLQANQILSYFNLIRSNNWNSSTPPLFGVPASAWYDYILATDSVSINYNISNLPTLFVGLGLDINVPPSELVRFQNEITITNDFWSIAGLNHYMTPNNDPQVAESLTDTIVHWLRQNNIVTALNPPITEEGDLTVYPNPFKDQISIKTSTTGLRNAELKIRNAFGEVVWEAQNIDMNKNSELHFQLKKIASGTYFLEIKDQNLKLLKKIVRH